jgi:hypothetical protein
LSGYHGRLALSYVQLQLDCAAYEYVVHCHMNSFVYAEDRRGGKPPFTPNLNTKKTHPVYEK